MACNTLLDLPKFLCFLLAVVEWFVPISTSDLQCWKLFQFQDGGLTPVQSLRCSNRPLPFTRMLSPFERSPCVLRMRVNACNHAARISLSSCQ